MQDMSEQDSARRDAQFRDELHIVTSTFRRIGSCVFPLNYLVTALDILVLLIVCAICLCSFICRVG